MAGAQHIGADLGSGIIVLLLAGKGDCRGFGTDPPVVLPLVVASLVTRTSYCCDTFKYLSLMRPTLCWTPVIVFQAAWLGKAFVEVLQSGL